MTNREIARTLDHIADILQFLEENPFKIKAYRQAANSIYHLDEDIQYLYEKDRLGEIPGVGKAIQSKLEELIEKGSLEYYERLLTQVPPGLLDMLAIPGVGHKTIKMLYEQLGVTTRDELLQAAQQKRIRLLPGMGSKTEFSIIKGIEMLEQYSQKNTLGFVLPMGQKMLSFLRGMEQVSAASLAGSIRRGCPLVTDIDIVVAADDEAAVRNKLAHYREIRQVTNSQPGHIQGFLQFNIPFEVIILAPGEYCPGLFLATGSKQHLAGLFPGGPTGLEGLKSESDIYASLGLDYIPPELREDQGELEAAATGRLPALIRRQDLQGDLHCHSGWSDGASKLAELGEMARDMQYSYLAITDHSRSLAISGGLNEERLAAQGQEIDQLNQQWDDFQFLKGTEVDILRDGSLDYDAEILEKLDVVVASIHTNFHLEREKQTERIIQAIKDENVDIIGHLTGRLLNRRPAYELDLEAILAAAAGSKIILEINSHPDRLDIDAELARQARDMGIKIAVNSDAHHKNDLRLVHYGIINARRGWLRKEDVINTRSREAVIAYLKNNE